MNRGGSSIDAPDADAHFTFKNAEQFVAAFRSALWPNGVFYGTYRRFDVGQLVRLKVGLGRERPPVFITGVVSCFRRSQRHPRIVGGVGIDLHPGARPKVEYLLRLHSSAQSPAQDPTNRRRHDRLTLDFPVTWQRSWSEPALARLRDIGYGGAFVKDAQSLPVGDSVLLGLSVPGADVPTVVTARVAWVSLDAIPGFGVKWRARDTGGLRLIREMVSRIAMPPTAE